MGAIFCPHGYSHPPAASDDADHATRPARILRQLPEPARLNYLYGEAGCDGGCNLAPAFGVRANQKPGRGWRDYFPDARAYADWLAPFAQAVAWDPLCVGAAIFLSGADPAGQPNFTSFDIGDEVDLRPLFTADVPGPQVAWLGPTAGPVPAPTPTPSGGPIVSDVVLSVSERHTHAADGNWGAGEPFGPCRGVVIHSTGGGASSLENEFTSTIAWFTNPDAGVSAHAVIGAGKFSEVCRTVGDLEKAYHAREPSNTNRRGIELAHPDGLRWESVQYPTFQYEAAGELIARWKLADEARGWVWPIALLSRAQLARNPDAPGIAYHRDLPAGIADGRRDPTPPFDGSKLIAAASRWYARLSAGLPTPAPTPPAVPPEVIAALDTLWAYVGADVAKQRTIVAVKIALGLQVAP
jgi:hypothetical protein